MAFDYEASVNAVSANLLAHNTTTAAPDVSSGLTTRVRTVRVCDPEVAAIKFAELPAVFVRVVDGNEEPASLGGTGPTGVQKFKDVVFEVVAMYHRDGAHTDHPDHLLESYRLAENIEGVFQAEYRLSNTALWCHPENTTFGGFNFGNVRVRASVTRLRAKYMFR